MLLDFMLLIISGKDAPRYEKGNHEFLPHPSIFLDKKKENKRLVRAGECNHIKVFRQTTRAKRKMGKEK